MEIDPIERFIARARRDGCIMASELVADDLVLLHVIARGARPPLSEYEHVVTGRRIVVDAAGHPHRWSGGQYREHGRLTHAVWQLEPLLMRAARLAPTRRHLHLVR